MTLHIILRSLILHFPLILDMISTLAETRPSRHGSLTENDAAQIRRFETGISKQSAIAFLL